MAIAMVRWHRKWRARPWGSVRWAVLAVALVAASVPPGCSPASVPSWSSPAAGDEKGGETCPATKDAPDPLPGVRAEHRSVAYWIERTSKADAVVLSAAEIARHNAAFAAVAAAQPDREPLTHADLLTRPAPGRFLAELGERLGYMAERIRDGRYLDAAGHRLSAELMEPFAVPGQLPPMVGELRVAVAPIALRCGPRAAGLFKGPAVDPRFDRNSCSTIRPQEPLEILARWAGGMTLVRTRYTFGWIGSAAPLSPPVPADQAAAFANGPRLRAVARLTLRGQGGRSLTVADKTLLTAGPERRALFATVAGFDTSQPLSSAEAFSTVRPLTRSAMLEEAFSYLGTPYGWGGHQGGRDCSRFLMDVFWAFGLHLPRHSGVQAKAGSFVIDIAKLTGDPQRLALIDEAAGQGVVLLHFPGHIMLYLGRNAAGVPMAIHAFAEYLERCDNAGDQDGGPGETLLSVDRVQVSDLTLGGGTSRRSFLERITHITVMGRRPSQALLGVAERRPPAPLGAPAGDCRDSEQVAMLLSPRRPHPGQMLRVVVTASVDLGSVGITLTGPEGQTVRPPLRRVGGPPFGYLAELASPRPGQWTARLGDGNRIKACEQVTVRNAGAQRQAAGGHVWVPRARWTEGTENLYATWVEQLFDYPLDDRTWPDLQTLLGHQANNVLYNHLGQDEDAALALGPDCADLPYFLRAYFAWKLRLPFAYRLCNRGRKGKVPYCDADLHDHLVEPAGATEVAAFAHFARRNIADGVHSGSGRTAPEAEDTDYYPVPLTREAIKPGVTFADPYGHLFVVADWIPQSLDGYGVLVGADAQPDGTIGRRRFWRGSFLFTPDTSEVGAGFKAFRPLRYRGGRIRPVTNAAIASLPGMTPHSLQQYQGTTDDFYDQMEALINPRPLDSRQQLDVLIEAFYEQVKRRVISVQNSEDYQAEHRKMIAMPRGHAIFETTGPWEDYSTPSRDMRLLIALDTVLGFSATVKRRPERFGLSAGAGLAGVITALEGHLDRALTERRFRYRRSDGSAQELSAKDVAARSRDFEMAYNPNDCVEVRWAAPEGSDERATCRKRAPGPQQRRMSDYRKWFAERRRPAR